MISAKARWHERKDLVQLISADRHQPASLATASTGITTGRSAQAARARGDESLRASASTASARFPPRKTTSAGAVCTVWAA